MKKLLFIHTYIDYAILLIVGLPAFFWFTRDIWIYGDILIPLNPSISKFIQTFGYTWNYMVNDLGGPYIWLPRFLYNGLFVLMKQCGLDLSISERLYFYFTYTLSGLTMYYLARTLFIKDSTSKQRIIAVISGLVYMYNPFLFVNIMYLPYSLVPFLLALFVRGVRNPNNLWYIVGFSITVMLINITFPTLGIMILSLILVVAFAIYLFFSKEVQHFFLNILLFSIQSSILLCLLNAWWLLPYLEQVTVFSKQLESTPIPWFVYRNAILRELLRWLGWWPYYTDYYPYTFIYKNNFFFVVLSILPMILASCAILLKREKEVIFLLSLVVFGLFMAKGPNPPFGEVMEHLFIAMPLMKILRETPKFMLIVTVAVSLLIGVTCSEFYVKMKKYIKGKYNVSLSTLLLLFILSLLIINAFPVILGQTLFRANDPQNISVTIPEEYWTVSKLIKVMDNNNYTTLYFPPMPARLQYKWGHAGANILPEIFESPLIYGQTSAAYDNPYLKEIISSPESYIKLLSLINVKYIIVDSSVSDSRVESIITAIMKNPDIKVIANFNYLSLFEIKSSIPRIYLARCILFASNLMEAELVISSLNLTFPVIFDLREIIHFPKELYDLPIYIAINTSKEASEFFSQGEFKRYEICSPISSLFSIYSITPKNITYIGNAFLYYGNNSIYIPSKFIKNQDLLVFAYDNQHCSKYNEKLSIKFVSPTEYILRIDAPSQSNAFLVFSNSYDPLWDISTDYAYNTFLHYKTLLGTNAWMVNLTSKEMTIRICYRPQFKMQLGFLIGLVGVPPFLICHIWLNSLKSRKFK
jgi:hypothetical protein